MISYSIDVVDDEKSIRNGIQSAFGADYRIRTFETAEAALEAMTDAAPDLVLLDVGLPGMDGVTALGRIKDLYPDLPVIMVTAYEDVDTVISAMKRGAYDYVIKPIHLDSLEVTITNAIETIRLRKEVKHLQEKYLQENLPCFIAESDVIQDVMEFIAGVARSPDTPVMILGATGTGKELIASAIHFRSPNFRGPIISVNCSAIPRDLIESELFGYERGAFSGAREDGKQGLVEAAAGGTLFLDEVGDLSLAAQAKLLRFVESGEFYKVGGTSVRKIQTRVVSATHKNIVKMIEKNEFRSDLYYRLGVIKVRIPSLMERRDDILPLARFFLDMFGRKFKREFTGITAEGERRLLDCLWPGNVRELRNVMERAALIAKGPKIDQEDLVVDEDFALCRHPEADEYYIPPSGVDFPAAMEAFKRGYIEKALKVSGGNETQAARLLKVNYHTFRYHCEKLGLKS